MKRLEAELVATKDALRKSKNMFESFKVVWGALKEIERYPCECGDPVGSGDCPVCIADEAIERIREIGE